MRPLKKQNGFKQQFYNGRSKNRNEEPSKQLKLKKTNNQPHAIIITTSTSINNPP